MARRTYVSPSFMAAASPGRPRATGSRTARRDARHANDRRRHFDQPAFKGADQLLHVGLNAFRQKMQTSRRRTRSQLTIGAGDALKECRHRRAFHFVRLSRMPEQRYLMLPYHSRHGLRARLPLCASILCLRSTCVLTCRRKAHRSNKFWDTLKLGSSHSKKDFDDKQRSTN